MCCLTIIVRRTREEKSILYKVLLGYSSIEKRTKPMRVRDPGVIDDMLIEGANGNENAVEIN